MRAVIQRVSRGSVTVDSKVVGEIDKGLVVLLGVGEGDTLKDAEYIADKTVNLRIFEDEDGKFNFSALDLGLEILAISQFTLYGDCRKGRRPSFTDAAAPDNAKELYEKYVGMLKNYGLKVETGIFQADMQVEIVNIGPVTMLLDSKREF